MKNKFWKSLSLFFIGLVFFSCKKEIRKNDLSMDNLKGKISSVVQVTYLTGKDSVNIQKGVFGGKIVTQYNDLGNKDYSNYYDNDDDIISKQINFSYNENGLKTEEEMQSLLENKKKTKYTYENNGNLKQSIEYNYDGSLRVTTKYKYDDHQNLLETYDQNVDGSFESKSTFKYDKNGNKIELCLNTDSTTSTKINFKYDNKGNISEENWYSALNRNNIKFIHKYILFDKEGNWIKKIVYDNNRPESIIERTIYYH